MARPRTSRYTLYAPSMTAAHTLLNKLFRSKDPKVRPPAQDLVGQEAAAWAATIAIANADVVNGVGGLKPANGMQSGDPRMFPNGVDLSYHYATGPANQGPPEVDKVKWVRPGDPANGYFADITSPGPGLTDGTDKQVDPDLKVVDIKPNYPVIGSTDNTKKPLDASTGISKENDLTVIPDLGKSGG